MKHITVLSLFILTLLSGCSRKQGDVSPAKVEVQRVTLAEAAKTMTLTGEIRAQVESDLGFRTDVLDILQESLAFLPGYGIKAYLIAQDINQLYAHYGRDEAITSTCHVQCAFAPNRIET